MLKIVLYMEPAEAHASLAYLNADQGLRNAAADRLLKLNKPLQQEAMIAVVNGLAQVSAALSASEHSSADYDAKELARASRVKQGLRGVL